MRASMYSGWHQPPMAAIEPDGYLQAIEAETGQRLHASVRPRRPGDPAVLVADPSEANDKTKYVVVEFTPRWEAKFGFDDSNYDAMRQAVIDKIQGKWVKFSGWMLFDFIHQDASQSTAPGNPVCPNDGKLHSGCNWRATPWEVHPVTAYTVVSGP